MKYLRMLDSLKVGGMPDKLYSTSKVSSWLQANNVVAAMTACVMADRASVLARLKAHDIQANGNIARHNLKQVLIELVCSSLLCRYKSLSLLVLKSHPPGWTHD